MLNLELISCAEYIPVDSFLNVRLFQLLSTVASPKLSLVKVRPLPERWHDTLLIQYDAVQGYCSYL
jgi:hypothetical protein